MPIPWMFALAFVAGVVMQHLVPLTIDSPTIIVTSGIVGSAFVIGGVMLAFSSRTAPSTLITGGAYRLTRNPMYVGLTLTYAGVAGIQGQIWPLLLLPFLDLYIHYVVIPVEEARLREVFGAAYERYCIGVPRWI